MFEIKDQFYLNGVPFQIISGAIHYFRVVPEYWEDRLIKLKNMGCNTVETYIPWNFHETQRGSFLWEGKHDICRFIELAQKHNLYIIIRPSPYICAEWEFGGLPAWLLKDRNMRLRCSYQPYLDAVKDYYSVLIPKLVPYQLDRGGKIILFQLENEYGYYGNDKKYLEFLRDTVRSLGIQVPLVTSDGPWNETIFRSGMVDGALATGNFGSSGEWQFNQLNKFIGDGKPLMCMEFWNGWFDAWGEEHHTTEPEKAAYELNELLKRGSVNFYMFEGGTNFGFMNGRNGGCKTCDVTSYDYDAPLTEDGQITPKYKLFKEIIRQYRDFDEEPYCEATVRKCYGEVECIEKVDLFSTLDMLTKPILSSYPLTMEEIDQNYGYILYRMRLGTNEAPDELLLENVSDRIKCYQNGEEIFTAFGDNIYDKFSFSQKENGAVIDLLCENLGRENFGTNLENQRKGIVGGVKLNDRRWFGYEIFSLELDEEQITKIDFTKDYSENKPAFYKFEFNADELGDTFLDFTGFGKGCAFINGFNLGRLWSIGPQKRLYIPKPLIKMGVNEIIIFETEGQSANKILLADKPSL